MAKKKTRFTLFGIINATILIMFSLICLLPFVHVVAASFSTPVQMLKHPFMLFPFDFSLAAYEYVFSANTLIKSILVSAGITVFGTMFNMFMTTLMAYPLSRPQLMGKSFILRAVVFTMVFSGGMIPTFLVVRSFHLLDTFAALVLPGSISAFNLLIMKNFFQQIPLELEESAKIDGYNDLQIYVKIMLPLSMASLATITLFYAVGHWNSYMNAVLYINDVDKYPVQIILRQVVALASGGIGDASLMDPDFIIPTATVKMSTIVISITPIMIAYPFLQKYFVKGALLGSVKG